MKDYTKYDKYVSKQRLKTALKKSEYTLKALASMMGLPESTLNGYLYGINNIPLRHLFSLCLSLGLTADYVLGLVDVNET